MAVSEYLRDTSLLTRDQMDKCIGSIKFSICHETLATQRIDSSSLSTLYLGNILDAMEVCDTEPFPLPLKDKSTDKGHGRPLITSARADFDFKETYVNATTMAGAKIVQGCRNCPITLPCGKQLNGNNIKIRCDLSSCSKVTPIILEVELAEPMANLFRLLLPGEELPYYTTKVEANMKLLSSLNLELQAQLSHAYRQNLQQISQPIAHKTNGPKIVA